LTINIDDLTEEELLVLNHRIVARLKFLESYHTHKEMMRFVPGDKVSFVPQGRDALFGVLVKFNKKTATIINESGHKWNVSPHLLRNIKDAEPAEPTKGNGMLLISKIRSGYPHNMYKLLSTLTRTWQPGGQIANAICPPERPRRLTWCYASL